LEPEYNGNILLSRPNRGLAATAMFKGRVRDIAFRAHDSLESDLGVAAMEAEFQSSSWLLHARQPGSVTISTSGKATEVIG